MSGATVTGAQAVNARLQQVLDNAHTGINAGIAHAVDVTYDGSQTDVAVDKGDLKASGVKKTSDLYGEVSYSTNHPWFVELGTCKMRAQPYLYPNFINGGVPTLISDVKAMPL
jgi:hypothetical protein